MSNPDELMSLSEKRFLDDIQQHYNLLANEAKKKHPHVKEACETGIIRVRNASSVRMLAAMGLRAAFTTESAQILEPFFMGCDARSAKMVQISVNAMQKMIIFESLNSMASGNMLNCLWHLMEHGIEEVKILQTITLLLTTNQLVTGDQLAKTVSLCFRLYRTKNSTTNNTASATIRQLITVIFERVQNEDLKRPGLDQPKSLDTKLFQIDPNDGRYRPTSAAQLGPAAMDAFNFLQDLIQIINGETAFWLSGLVEIGRTFSLELLELILDQFSDIFQKHNEFAFLLKEKVCQLVIQLFSPNIKQRGQFSLSPLLPGSSSSGSFNSNSGSPASVASSTSAATTNLAQSVHLSSSGFNWPITVRLMRIVSVLIRNYFEMLVTESEIFLSLLVKSLEVDKLNWQRSIALEALYRMIQPNLIAQLCKSYDMKPASSKILRDLINALCIYIQSQFQIVDTSTTQSLIASLVNNTNSGQGNGGSGNVQQNHSGSNTKNSTFPVFNLRGISISLLFIPFHKSHRYRTFFIEQLEKLEPPQAPDGHGLSTALACIFELASTMTKIIDNDFEKYFDLDQNVEDTGNEEKEESEQHLNFRKRIMQKSDPICQELKLLHRNMLGSTFGGFIGTFSLLLDASTDEVATELVLEQIQKLCHLYGLYGIGAARDAALISICKSSLPANYYPIEALNPYNLDLDDSLLLSSSSSASAANAARNSQQQSDPRTNNATPINLNSLNHSITETIINLPNLLEQQNNGQSYSGGSNGSNGSSSSGSGHQGSSSSSSSSSSNLNAGSNIQTNISSFGESNGGGGGGTGSGSGGGHGGGGGNDFSRQIIAVGTSMPTAHGTSGGNGGGQSGQQQSGPVMLTSKNLQCMNSLLSIANRYGYIFEEQSWYIVFTTLQHLVWILGLKPNSQGVYRLPNQLQSVHQHHNHPHHNHHHHQDYSPNSPGVTTVGNVSNLSSSSGSTAGGATNTVITNAAMSDLPVLTTMLSRMFECTQQLDDESLIKLIKSLITLSNEALEVAYNNREPSLFALVKLLETGLVNLKRIDLIFDLVTTHLIEVSAHPYSRLREWSVDVLCNLVKSILTTTVTVEPTSNDEKTESDNHQDQINTITTTPNQLYSISQSYYLNALHSLSQIKYVDIRQKQIECILQLLQSSCGEYFTDGWPVLFSIIESACAPQNDNLIRCSFQCYQFIISDLLSYVPSIYLIHCINSAVAFGSQLQELNVSLTAIGLIWNVADFLHSNQTKIEQSLQEYQDQGHRFVGIQLPPVFVGNAQNHSLEPFQSLWISLFKNLSNLCTDSRLSIRKSSGQTLFSTLSNHGVALDYNTWKAIFFYVLYPLIDSVRTLCSVASNDRITQSESSISNSKSTTSYGDGSSEYIIHYSRNTAFKQWCETQVLVLTGISRMICFKLDLFVGQITVPPTTTDNTSQQQEEEDIRIENENLLQNVWSLFFEFLQSSAVNPNAEVSTAALKCFNEIVLFLNEYSAKLVSTSTTPSMGKTSNLLLLPIWKIIWKTWYSIGQHIGPNQSSSLAISSSSSSSSSTNSSIAINDQSSSSSSPGSSVHPMQHSTTSKPLTASSSGAGAGAAPVPSPIIIPSQVFLCLLIKPLFCIVPKIIGHQFTESDFKKLSFVLQNSIATPFLNEPSVYVGHTASEPSLTQLQTEVLSLLDKIQELIQQNLSTLNGLLSYIFYQYFSFSLYTVNIIPPHLHQFINSQFQHRFLPGELTSFNTVSYYIFGECALKSAFNLYQATYKEPVVIKSHILHSIIRAYKIPLCFRYSCPLQSTWRYAVNYFVKSLELGLPLARKFPNEFNSIWADLAQTFDGFLFPANKPPTNQNLDDQQLDESLDVKVVELIRDQIMLYAQHIPKEFLLQIVSILNRGSIHSPSITSPIAETEINRKLREDFARVCFQTLLQFSFFGPKGNPDLFINNNNSGSGATSGTKSSPDGNKNGILLTSSSASSPEHSIGIVNKLAVASILKRFNDVIVKYVEDEQLCPCPLPRHRLSEISFVLKALATLILSLKEAPPGSVETHVWRQLIELYPRIVDCTMSNSPQVNKSIREVLHEYSYLLSCPKPQPTELESSSKDPNHGSSSMINNNSNNGDIPQTNKVSNRNSILQKVNSKPVQQNGNG